MSVECECYLCRRNYNLKGSFDCENCILCSNTDHNVIGDGDNEDERCPMIHVENEYYSPADFKNIVSKDSPKSSLKTHHFNCRSLKCNFDAFSSTVEVLQDPMTIIGVSETWLKENEKPFVSLPHFEFIGNCRHNKRGGGVGLYVHQNLRYKRRPDLDVFCDSLESIFIEVYTKFRKCIIAVMYRPPNRNCSDFFEKLNSTLDLLKKEKKECIIMGDFNINILDTTNPNSTDFLNLFLSYSYIPQINKPTRITETCATSLDNIFYNSAENVINSGIITTDVSDHLTPFMVIDFCKSIKSKAENTYYEKYDLSEINIEHFCSELESVDWESLNTIEDVNEMYDKFLLLYKTEYEKCFPVIKIQMKSSRKYNPWITKDTRGLIRRKNNLYRKYVKNPTSYRHQAYKSCRNAVNSKIRKEKRAYYNSKFENAKDDLKKTWNVINEVMNKQQTKSTISEIEDNDKHVTNKQEIVNIFNDFFVSIGKKMQERVKRTSKSERNMMKKNAKWLKGNFAKSLFLNPVVSSDIEKIVSKLDSNKSPGYDGIHPKVVKRSISAISEPLCNIANLAMNKGVFPDSLKVAKVIPIYKSGNRSLLTNYRPISVLSVFSKIFERIIYDNLMFFIENNDILYNRQYGFRHQHSTYHTLIDFTEKISNAFESNKFLIGIFLDLSKAFDCIDHNILFDKLYFYGIRGIALDLIKSYLTNRKQYVNIENTSSSFLDITLGVPQGSNLGPLLFLLYVNDLPNASDILSFILFADDTNLFLASNDQLNISNILNAELEKVNSWFLANKLLINFSKTNYMIFKPQNKRIDENLINVFIDNNHINKVTSVKFLGVRIDSKLLWKEHITDISLKISSITGVLNRLKSTLPLPVLLKLYNSMILPYLTYCNIIWGKCASYLLQKLFLLQKRAIRIITNSPYLAHTNDLFSKLKVLNIYKLHSYFVGSFMFSYMNNMVPKPFRDFFTLNSNINHYVTRNSNKFYIPNYRYNFSRAMIKYKGPVLWNSIPDNVKCSPSMHLFKQRYKFYLINS